MKNLFIVLISAGFFLACNNAKTSNEKMGKEVDPAGFTDVQNVNGNIPDTNNSIKIDPRQPDSTGLKTDSVDKK